MLLWLLHTNNSPYLFILTERSFKTRSAAVFYSVSLVSSESIANKMVELLVSTNWAHVIASAKNIKLKNKYNT